jgi:hypothetical protein
LFVIIRYYGGSSYSRKCGGTLYRFIAWRNQLCIATSSSASYMYDYPFFYSYSSSATCSNSSSKFMVTYNASTCYALTIAYYYSSVFWVNIALVSSSSPTATPTLPAPTLSPTLSPTMPPVVSLVAQWLCLPCLARPGPGRLLKITYLPFLAFPVSF